jgi:hypothetical protein
MSQSGGTGGVFLGGDGHAAFTLPDNVKGGLGSPIQAGFGVTGWGGSGQSAADVPTNATNVVPVNPGVGVVGVGGQEPQTGTVPSDTANPGSGVVGMATSAFIGLSPFNIWTQNGVVGIGPTGVYGFSETGLGVLGASLSKGGAAGVAGVGADGGIGVTGFVPVSSTKADAQTVAIFGWVGGTPKQSGKGPYAGWFQGPVVVDGDFTVMAPGTKSIAVPFSDGSHRRLYCMESPECWFEDFGEAKLVKGKAQIKLPRDFAAVINVDSYHVFLTPYGASNGLYVSKRTRQGFVVEEQGHGKSSLSFSFRIVGKAKDVKAGRFAKVKVSKAPQPKPKTGPKPPKLPVLKDPKVKVKLPTKPSIGRPPAGCAVG